MLKVVVEVVEAGNNFGCAALAFFGPLASFLGFIVGGGCDLGLVGFFVVDVVVVEVMVVDCFDARALIGALVVVVVEGLVVGTFWSSISPDCRSSPPDSTSRLVLGAAVVVELAESSVDALSTSEVPSSSVALDDVASATDSGLADSGVSVVVEVVVVCSAGDSLPPSAVDSVDVDEADSSVLDDDAASVVEVKEASFVDEDVASVVEDIPSVLVDSVDVVVPCSSVVLEGLVVVVADDSVSGERVVVVVVVVFGLRVVVLVVFLYLLGPTLWPVP